MTETYKKWKPPTLINSRNVISLAALLDGRKPYKLRDIQTYLAYGLEVARVNRSRGSTKAEIVQLTLDMYGLNCTDSLTSANLQSCLESRLRAKTQWHGYVECAMTWKSLAMPSGPPICVHRPSVRRIYARDYTGVRYWPTPIVKMTGYVKHEALPQNINPKTTTKYMTMLRDTNDPMFHIDWRDCAKMDGGMNIACTNRCTTVNGAEPNPEHVCWLMGFREEWITAVKNSLETP